MLIVREGNFHYVYIKDFNRFKYNKQIIKTISIFVWTTYSALGQGFFLQFIVCNNRTQSPALFQNIFKFCTFSPKFSNILPFLPFFNIFLPYICPFSENLKAWPYFLGPALTAKKYYKNFCEVCLEITGKQ